MKKRSFLIVVLVLIAVSLTVFMLSKRRKRLVEE